MFFWLELFENKRDVMLCLNRLSWRPQPKPERSRVLKEKKDGGVAFKPSGSLEENQCKPADIWSNITSM